MNTCYIFGAADGVINSINIDNTDIVIAADAGVKLLNKLNITPDIVVGDFDSLGYIPSRENVIVCPVMKDDTDMIIAINKGIEMKYNKFIICGGYGGNRPDHTFANFQTLCHISRMGKEIYLCCGDYIATAVTNGKIIFNSKHKGTISVFSFGTSEGVTLANLKYELNNAVLSDDYPLGVSNSFIGKTAEVSVKNGTLLVMWNGEKNDVTKVLTNNCNNF